HRTKMVRKSAERADRKVRRRNQLHARPRPRAVEERRRDTARQYRGNRGGGRSDRAGLLGAPAQGARGRAFTGGSRNTGSGNQAVVTGIGMEQLAVLRTFAAVTTVLAAALVAGNWNARITVGGFVIFIVASL